MVLPSFPGTFLPMVGRKGGLSGKQKSALLKAKRAQQHPATEPVAANGGTGAPASAAPASVSELRMTQQVSRKGEVNTLSTRFVREDDQVVAARKLRGAEPFAAAAAAAAPLSYAASGVGAELGLPARPARRLEGETAVRHEAAEQAAFDAWLESVHGRYSLDELSPFKVRASASRAGPTRVTRHTGESQRPVPLVLWSVSSHAAPPRLHAFACTPSPARLRRAPSPAPLRPRPIARAFARAWATRLSLRHSVSRRRRIRSTTSRCGASCGACSSAAMSCAS